MQTSFIRPKEAPLQRALIRRVLVACALTTSDSRHMAERMTAFGAREMMTFPLSLESLPAVASVKNALLFFASRGLENLYALERVLAVFAGTRTQWPDAQLVVGNDGALCARIERDQLMWPSSIAFANEPVTSPLRTGYVSPAMRCSRRLRAAF
jgi:hypothetical protein